MTCRYESKYQCLINNRSILRNVYRLSGSCTSRKIALPRSSEGNLILIVHAQMQAFCDCCDAFCLSLQHALLLPLADVLQQNVLPKVAVIFASITNLEIRETISRISLTSRNPLTTRKRNMNRTDLRTTSCNFGVL